MGLRLKKKYRPGVAYLQKLRRQAERKAAQPPCTIFYASGSPLSEHHIKAHQDRLHNVGVLLTYFDLRDEVGMQYKRFLNLREGK